jgi:hypothetical protein
MRESFGDSQNVLRENAFLKKATFDHWQQSLSRPNRKSAGIAPGALK